MSAPSSPTLSDSELLDSLEEHFDLGAERERRMAQLHSEARRAKELAETEYGRVVTYGEEKKLIERMSKEKWLIVHFFHPDFPRCRIMDKKLEEIAPKYKHTLFLRASVADVPFLVNKFGIQVLPCVLVFVDSRCVDRLIGFEDLGNTDSFSSKTLEFRLGTSGALPAGNISLATMLPTGKLARDGNDDSSDDEAHRDKSRVGRAARRGKVGVRNGFAGVGSDDDF